MSFNIFDIQARAKIYASLSPMERSLLKTAWSLVWHAVVTGLLAILYAAYAAVTGGTFDPRNVLIAGGVATLLAFVDGVRKFASASADPTLEVVAGLLGTATGALATRVPPVAQATYARAAATANRYDPFDTAAVPAAVPANQVNNQARTFDESFLNDQPTAGLPNIGYQGTPGQAPSLSMVQRNIPPLPPQRR